MALTTTFFLPVWFIFLIAPQYPEGLTMDIWLYKITGQVDIINGLNHYIGMKHIKVEMFPEFRYMIFVMIFFIAFGLVVAITGRRKLLLAYLILTVIGGLAIMDDFYEWGYVYGHNLDPKAAIQVPGLSYQPPLVGHKTLLNFDAYSYPDIGGWVVIGAGISFFLVWLFEWRSSRIQKKVTAGAYKKTIPAVAAMLIFTASSCTTKPQAINYGKDICSDCSMAIMDPKYGSEIITKKGRIFKFDDARCLIHFIISGGVKAADIEQTVFIDYENDKNFVPVESISFVVSPLLKSPMNGNVVAFSNALSAKKIASQIGGVLKNWGDLKKSVR